MEDYTAGLYSWIILPKMAAPSELSYFRPPNVAAFTCKLPPGGLLSPATS